MVYSIRNWVPPAFLVVGWLFVGTQDSAAQRGRTSAGLRQVFELAARGRGFFLVSEMGPLRGPLTAFAGRHGIADGKITFDLFSTFTRELRAQANGTASAPIAPAGEVGKKSPPPPRGSPESIKLWAERDFRRRDRNGDKSLNFDEMSSTLRGDLYQWDKSRDNLIDLEEYQVYFLERVQRRNRGSSVSEPLTVIIEDSLDKRPQVLRAGNLPEKGLPAWFQPLDEDEDGQVALYEWYQQGKELAEFTWWDRDDDGLITPQEALVRQATLEEEAKDSGRGD